MMDTQTYAFSYLRRDAKDISDITEILIHQAQIHQYAAHHGIYLLAEYYDSAPGISLERPGLTRMLADIAQYPICMVIATQMDRLARNRFDFIKLQNLLSLQGVKIVCASDAGELIRLNSFSTNKLS